MSRDDRNYLWIEATWDDPPEPVFFTCSECRDEFHAYTVHGEAAEICDDCLPIECEDCGAELEPYQVAHEEPVVDERPRCYCLDCAREAATECDDCGGEFGIVTHAWSEPHTDECGNKRKWKFLCGGCVDLRQEMDRRVSEIQEAA